MERERQHANARTHALTCARIRTHILCGARGASLGARGTEPPTQSHIEVHVVVFSSYISTGARDRLDDDAESGGSGMD